MSTEIRDVSPVDSASPSACTSTSVQTGQGASMASSATIPHSDIVLSRDGAGDRAIVFVHGFLDDQHVWNAVIAELKAPGFEIVRFDHAGFGGRADASGPFSYDRFASDLSAVVDMLDKPFVLVGHSLGATVAELVAAARPDRALGLALLSPIQFGGTRIPDAEFEPIRAAGELGAAEYQGFRRQFAPAAPEAELERLAAVAAGLRPEVVRTVADMWNNGYPAGPRPSGYSGPVLVLRGTEDPLLTEDVIASAVTSRFEPAETAVTVIEAGHWAHIEQPSAVAADIDRFLATNLAIGAVGAAAKNG
jgi:pimeloyl-ACP methyl ester carboxylesterase